jgi:ABC transporter DrrB family efflux protein
MTTDTITPMPGRFRRTLADTGVLARRDLLATVRMRDVLVLSAVQPIIFMLLFLYVFGGAIEAALPPAAAGAYVNWLVPGILAQFAVFGASATAYGLHNDRTTGAIERFRSLPMARAAVLAGRTLADLARSGAILLLQLGVGVLLGFRPQTGLPGVVAALGLALAFGYACSWIMATIGLAVRNTEAIQATVYSVVFPLTLLSSVFLPTQTMPSWLRAFADHQPVTAVANALRGLLLGAEALPPGQTVIGQTLIAFAWTAGILATVMPLAVRAYRRTVS